MVNVNVSFSFFRKNISKQLNNVFNPNLKCIINGVKGLSQGTPKEREIVFAGVSSRTTVTDLRGIKLVLGTVG